MAKNRHSTGELLLEAQNITKYYGDRCLFEADALRIYAGEHVGIVGVNGSGKTTLMEILAGVRPPDSGSVKRFVKTSYISQFDTGEEASLPGGALRKFAGQGEHSGGERMRLRIAGALEQGTALLMADEPTSNLDFDAITLLERELQSVSTLLLISHDRALLDAFCRRILEIRDGKITEYMGNYSDYLAERKRRESFAMGEYEGYVAEKKRLEASLQKQREKTSKMSKAPSRMGNSEARLHRMEIRQRKGKVEQGNSLLRSRLENLEEKEKPRELAPVHIDFRLTNPPANKIVLSARDLRFAYGKRTILDGASFEVPGGSKLALIGPNGAGKSTLLRGIMEDWPGIRKPPQVRCGLLAQQFEDMDMDGSALENVLRDSVQDQATCRNVLARLLLRGDLVHRPVRSLSGGERIKLGLARLIVSNANMLLLDEPTNYLDLHSLEALQEILRDYAGTVLFASHDRAFVDAVATGLLLFHQGKIQRFDGNLTAYRNKDKKTDDGLDKTLLQMRQAQLIAALSSPQVSDQEKERLEEDYQAVCAQLRAL